MEQKDYQAALDSLDVALAGGGLSPDQYSEALLGRAECHGRLGNYANAHEDLDRAERGAAMDQVHRVRSFVYQKEDRTTESQAELRKARQINGGIKAIEE
jgi:tetratricopeptide (TPR) repeat protein